MIVEALFAVGVGFINFFLGLLPTADPPSFVLGMTGWLDTVWDYASGLGAWIPYTVLGDVVVAVLASVGIGFAIKIARIVASFFTAGGGSAA